MAHEILMTPDDVRLTRAALEAMEREAIRTRNIWQRRLEREMSYGPHHAHADADYKKKISERSELAKKCRALLDSDAFPAEYRFPHLYQSGGTA
jgi:hypothetical protein